jgi:lipoprotein-anchoring transpeptidase ErfK/SrfK
MKKLLMLASAAIIAAAGSPAAASERYAERPPVVVSPDLSAPWVLQLGHKPGKLFARQRKVGAAEARGRIDRLMGADPVRTAAVRPQTRREAVRQTQRAARPQMDPVFLPQEVDYDGPHKPGTIVIDTVQNFLFLVEDGGKARRYGVGTGKPGFEWAGTHKITRKAEWPTWTPPEVMKARERAKGRILPDFMPGGPENPMGARALYIGSTEYRIHGTNQPWTIGGAVSSGCIRMRNEDVVDLYERADVGATVVVM